MNDAICGYVRSIAWFSREDEMSDYQAAWNLSYEIRQLKKEVARLRITKAEREAIELASDVIAECEDDDGEPLDGVAEVLRKLLRRLQQLK